MCDNLFYSNLALFKVELAISGVLSLSLIKMNMWMSNIPRVVSGFELLLIISSVGVIRSD